MSAATSTPDAVSPVPHSCDACGRTVACFVVACPSCGARSRMRAAPGATPDPPNRIHRRSMYGGGFSFGGGHRALFPPFQYQSHGADRHGPMQRTPMPPPLPQAGESPTPPTHPKAPWSPPWKQNRVARPAIDTTPVARPIREARPTGGRPPRIATGIPWVDMVLGQSRSGEMGARRGMVILLTGEPGVGKSTLLAQIGGAVASSRRLFLMGCVEENEEAIEERVYERDLIADGCDEFFIGCKIDNADAFASAVRKYLPVFGVLDSISDLAQKHRNEGHALITEAKLCREVAEKTGAILFLVGHINSEGKMAGRKSFDHLGDATVYVRHCTRQGEPLPSDVEPSGYVSISAQKTRAGPSGQQCRSVLRMTSDGLQQIDTDDDIDE